MKLAHSRDPATPKAHEMTFIDGKLITQTDQRAAAALNLVRAFLREHGTALANAAYHLGGGAASGSVFRLIDTLRDVRRLTSGHINRLERLNALLRLDYVGDSDRLETALFVEICPTSGLVDEICLLADNLDRLLERLRRGGDPEDLGEAGSFDDAA